MWCIWKEHNWRTSEDLDRSDDKLLALFIGSLHDCSRAWGFTSSDSLPLFLSSLFLCNWFPSLFFVFSLVLLCAFFEYTYFLPIKKKKKNLLLGAKIYIKKNVSRVIK